MLQAINMPLPWHVSIVAASALLSTSTVQHHLRHRRNAAAGLPLVSELA